MLELFFRRVCRNRGGRCVVAGAVGVLSGIEHLMRMRITTADPPLSSRGMLKASKPRQRCFEIRRTKSELGYVYWVLRGFGSFKCFELYDTWAEAMNHASSRLLGNATGIRSPLAGIAV